LWDIAGQDRFQKLTRAYFSKAKGVVIVCDLNRDGTIDAVRQWKREVTEWAYKTGNPDLPIILLANKSDMMDRSDPQAAFRMGVLMERLCREEHFLAWFMTSARSGECVEDGFTALIEEIMKVCSWMMLPLTVIIAWCSQ
jgi:GTPase SAR1 family protein